MSFSDEYLKLRNERLKKEQEKRDKRLANSSSKKSSNKSSSESSGSSFADNYLKLREERLAKEEEKKAERLSRTEERKSKNEEERLVKLPTASLSSRNKVGSNYIRGDMDIAPTSYGALSNKTTTGKNDVASARSSRGFNSSNEGVQKWHEGWLKKGSALSDGYDIGDVARTLISSDADVATNLISGVVGWGEDAIDAVLTAAGIRAEEKGDYEKAEKLKEMVSEDKYDPNEVSRKLLKSGALSGMPVIGNVSNALSLITSLDDWINTKEVDNGFDGTMMVREDNSIFDEKADGFIQSTGEAITKMGISSATGSLLSDAITGITVYGSQAEEALRNDATFKQAGGSALISAAAEIVFEKLSGGIKFGGVTLDEGATRLISKNISNVALKNGLHFASDVAGESLEEVLTEFVSRLGTKLYKEEDLGEILFSEEALQDYISSAIAGGLMGGSFNASNAINSTNSGRDYKTELNSNEQKVVEKEIENRIAKLEEDGKKLTKKEKNKLYEQVIEDMDSGLITLDTIEETLGGDAFKAYKDAADAEEALKTEHEELGKKTNATLAEQARYNELSEQLKDTSKREGLKKQLEQGVYQQAKNSRLINSYIESVRANQKFEADPNKEYKNEAAKKTVENIVNSGLLTNQVSSHRFVDFLTNIAEDKGIEFNLYDNESLAETVKNGNPYGINVDASRIQGFITPDNKNIVLNIDSRQALNSLVGHEVTHSIEDATVYQELQEAVFRYARKNGDYAKLVKQFKNTYESLSDEDFNKELTSELIGKYLFTDSTFVNNLSAEQPNVFQKVWNEIKYLWKMATAGSTEARELERVKKLFEDAYREGGKAKAQGETQFSIGEIVDENNKSYGIGVHLDSTLLDNLSPKERVKMVKEYVKELGGNSFTAYDGNGNAVDITIEKSDVRFKNKSGKGVPVVKDLTTKFIGNEVKQESIALVDELIVTSEYDGRKAPKYPHDWLDDNGKNDWEYWKTYIQDKNNTIWEAILNVANSADGRKILYDISPIKKVGRSVKSDTTPTNTNLAQDSDNVKYSLSDSSGRKLSMKQMEFFKDSKVTDDNGNLKVMYHGTPNGDFTVFKDGTYFTDNKEYADVYQNPGASSISSGKVASNPKTFEVYLNIKKPFDINDAEARDIYINDYIKGGNAMGINPYLSDAEYDKIKSIDWTEGEDLRDFLIENEYDYDGLVLDEGATGGYGDDVKSRGKSYVVFSPEQVKNTDNLNPTLNPDIRYSLTEYSAEEKKAHNKAVLEHFGKTYRWSETGYVLLDGTKLDLSGKHEGAPGGYRTVDHRDIADALGDDYGDDTYSGALIQFMSEGNIRISPESNGINLSVKPNKAQELSLQDFISKARGEVILDIDDPNGYTVISMEYPRGTHSSRVLNDIREWFDNGKKPVVSDLSQFRYSLDHGGEYAPSGDWNVYGRDIQYTPEDIAPVSKTEATVAKNAPVAPVMDDEFLPEENKTALSNDGGVTDNSSLATSTSTVSNNIIPQNTPSINPTETISDAETPSGEMRSWVETSTESEAVGRAILPDDLDTEKIYYQPISNKKTLGNANARLDSLGYEDAVTYFNGQFANKNISLDDIALGERLIQEAVKKGDYKTAGELITDISILGTELGQKVQALSIIKRLTPEGQLRAIQRTVERGKTKGDKVFEGVEVTQEMTDQILKTYKEDGTYDQNELNAAVENVKQQIADQMKVTKLEQVNAWRYLSMLGNPKTHIRNLVSNIAMKGTVAVKNAIARTVEDIAPIKNRTKTWKRSTETVKEFSRQKAVELKEVISGGGKYGESAEIKAKRDIFKNKILEGVYGFNSEMLSKEDWWFSRPAFTNALSECLTANGIRTKEDIDGNPEMVEKAIQYAIEQAQIATFQQTSWLANKIGEMERKNTLTNIAVGSILPFKKTPINIAKTGLNYSPLGFLKTAFYDVPKVKQGDMNASEMIDHLAQNITGSALTLAGYMLASTGFLNGAGEDDKEGKYDYQLGEQAYSINFGDSTYSLSWLSPVAMPLFVGVNMYEQFVEKNEWNGNVVIETMAKTLDPLSEMSFLSSLDSTLSSYDSGIMKFAGIFETAAQSYIGQFAPTLGSQIATVIDDTKRTTKVSGNSGNTFAEETFNKLIYKIPFLRETLEPSIDIWGNEIKQTENVMERAFETFLAPYAKRDDISSDVDAEIKDLYAQTGDNGLIPSAPYNYINYSGEKYNMSAKEYTNFKKEYGQTAFELLDELFDTTSYRSADSETKAELVNKIYDYARDEAKRDFFSDRGIEYDYEEDLIKGAIENDMLPDEYAFSIKYPEKYDFLKNNGISYNDYADADEEGKRAYTWAYDNPGKYTMSKVISDDFMTYYGYRSELNDIESDKDANGDTVSGSKKTKVINYINDMDLDYGQKIILYRSMYSSKEDRANYNADIVDYLNSRDDISYDEMVSILEELDMKVSSDGTVTWD